ncbi:MULTISPECIES: hypothetical protein [unclassified Paraburkholderia]|uniref:hypothetical protein n=1 Tax=unclassified Paraburkholderia TaxID=2615204 RepID=UPI002AB61E14|nr:MULTISPECIES: hypothetical protein [unclassified Paraburkholderia]
MRDLEEFCTAYQALAAARGQFQRRVRVGGNPERPDELLLLTTALNAATYRYLAAVAGLGEIDDARSR